MSDLFGLCHPIPCLSLWEPWASLMVEGFKLHETRHWPTKVRGQVAIHAAKKVDVGGAPHELCEIAMGPNWAQTRPAGCVLGVGDLTGCYRTEDVAGTLHESDLEAGNYAPGRFAFQVAAFRPLREPIPIVGRQGFFLWKPPADLEARLLAPVNHEAAALRWLAHLS